MQLIKIRTIFDIATPGSEVAQILKPLDNLITSMIRYASKANKLLVEKVDDSEAIRLIEAIKECDAQGGVIKDTAKMFCEQHKFCPKVQNISEELYASPISYIAIKNKHSHVILAALQLGVDINQIPKRYSKKNAGLFVNLKQKEFLSLAQTISKESTKLCNQEDKDKILEIAKSKFWIATKKLRELPGSLIHWLKDQIKDQYAYKISRTPIPALLEVIKQGDVKLIREIKEFITNDIKILQEEYQDIISESEAGIKEALEL